MLMRTTCLFIALSTVTAFVWASESDEIREKAKAMQREAAELAEHHLSLEDPVIKIFAGEWVQNVLKQLGMKEDEAIESQMVSRRIKQAQQKIEGRAFGSAEAESAERWLEKNCPELAKK